MVDLVVSKYETTDVDTMNRLGAGRASLNSALKVLAPSAAAYVAALAVFLLSGNWWLTLIPLFLLVGTLQRYYRVVRFVRKPSTEEGVRHFIAAMENARFRFTSEGVTLSARHGESEFKPSHFKLAVRGPGGVMLQSRSGNFILPDRVFRDSSQIDEVMGLLGGMGIATRNVTE